MLQIVNRNHPNVFRLCSVLLASNLNESYIKERKNCFYTISNNNYNHSPNLSLCGHLFPSGIFISCKSYWIKNWLYSNVILWSETDRLPDVSPAKIGLFGINREFQFGICNYGKPRASPPKAREGEWLYIGEGSWEGCSRQGIHDFSQAESFLIRKRSLSSFSWALLLSSKACRLPLLISQLYLIALLVC